MPLAGQICYQDWRWCTCLPGEPAALLCLHLWQRALGLLPALASPPAVFHQLYTPNSKLLPHISCLQPAQTSCSLGCLPLC